MRAQNERLRAASRFVLGFGDGARSLLPVALLYLALPFAVRPAPREIGSFSPRLTERLTRLLFLGIQNLTKICVNCQFSAKIVVGET